MVPWQIIAIAATVTVLLSMLIMGYLEYRKCADWKAEHPSVSPFTYIVGQAVLTTILWPIIGVAILIRQFIKH